MDDGSDQVEELTLEPVGPARRSRRVGALWAVLAAGAVVAGAVVVTTAGDDGGPAPGLPVALGSSGVDREASAAADAMLAPITYVAGDDLPALGGEAPAYRLTANVTEDQVRSLADALGLDGDVVHDGPSWTVDDGAAHLEVYEGGGAQWWYTAEGAGRIGVASSSSAGSGGEVETPSTPTTSIPEGCVATGGAEECLSFECTADCTQSTECDDLSSSCALPPTTTECGPGADCVAPVSPPPGDPDCAVASDEPDRCVDPSVPAPDLPSEADARAIGLDLLASTGIDVDDANVTVDGGYDAWYVVVEPRLDGVPTGMIASATVGEGGAIITASGTLVDPEPLGDYPLLDTRAAIDRANADVGVVQPGIATDAGTSTAAVAADTTIPPCAVQPDGRDICELPTCAQAVPPVDEPLEDPATIDCDLPVPDPGGVPAPAPDDGRVEVVLVDAERALLLLGAVDGTTDAYLVPAYRFTDADGGVVDLPAVADSALTTPPTTDTSAVTPPPSDTVVEPQPCDQPLVEEDASGTTHTIQPAIGCVAPDPVPLAEGEQPELGVGYYVDVRVSQHCGYVFLVVDGAPWWADGLDLEQWSTPTEGGTLTFTDDTTAEFVGDHQGTKVAELRPYDGVGEGPVCN